MERTTAFQSKINGWLANKVWSRRGLAKPDTINKENNLPLGHKECTSVIQTAKQSQKGDKKDRGFSTGQGALLNSKPCVWQNRKSFQLSKAVPSLLMTPISEAGNSPRKVQVSSSKGGQLLIANSSHLDKLVCLCLEENMGALKLKSESSGQICQFILRSLWECAASVVPPEATSLGT